MSGPELLRVRLVLVVGELGLAADGDGGLAVAAHCNLVPIKVLDSQRPAAVAIEPFGFGEQEAEEADRR